MIDSNKREYTFAQTFPTGTHAMWLYYWLATYGIHPMQDVKTIVVPPPQMVANMRIGNMDGYCVGEPWGARAIHDNIGFTAATTQDIWADHPEKVLGCTRAFVQQYPNTARAMLMAVLEAARYIDDMKNRSSVAKLIADKSYVNAPEQVIEQRFLGNYDNGLAASGKTPNTDAVLQQRRRSLPVPVRRHVVPDTASPLGPAEVRPGLPRGRQGHQPDRTVQTSGFASRCGHTRQPHAQQQAV
jgi:nitrate/nitrite transport system substrate-binding protein